MILSDWVQVRPVGPDRKLPGGGLLCGCGAGDEIEASAKGFDVADDDLLLARTQLLTGLRELA